MTCCHDLIMHSDIYVAKQAYWTSGYVLDSDSMKPTEVSFRLTTSGSPPNCVLYGMSALCCCLNRLSVKFWLASSRNLARPASFASGSYSQVSRPAKLFVLNRWGSSCELLAIFRLHILACNWKLLAKTDWLCELNLANTNHYLGFQAAEVEVSYDQVSGSQTVLHEGKAHPCADPADQCGSRTGCARFQHFKIQTLKDTVPVDRFDKLSSCAEEVCAGSSLKRSLCGALRLLATCLLHLIEIYAGQNLVLKCLASDQERRGNMPKLHLALKCILILTSQEL